jgi:signal transduction histidine kinase
MPRTEPFANSKDLQRCIRDLVALSALPAAWQNYDMRQIGSSIVAALISMLEADFVFIALPGHGDELATELARSSPKLDPADLKHVRMMLQREKATLGSGQEFVVADASGGRDLHVVTAPIGFGGDATLAAGSIRDALLLLAARLTAAGQMAAALAHELNQPLTAVVNSVNAAKRLLTRGDRGNLQIAREVTDEAAEQALRASEIVRSLRQFLTRDETERRVEILPSMMEEAGALALSSIGPLRVHLKFEFDDHAQAVLVNRVQIQQVIVNLIRNAFEAMADQDLREVTLATRALGNGNIEIAIADMGPGIPGDIAGRLFEPFVSTKRDGMGLGLSISRSIIEAHDGQLRAEPNPRGGTIFRFTLPCSGELDGR